MKFNMICIKLNQKPLKNLGFSELYSSHGRRYTEGGRQR